MFQDYKNIRQVVDGALQVNLPVPGHATNRYINMSPNPPAGSATYFTSSLPAVMPASGSVTLIWFVRADALKKTRDNLKNVVFNVGFTGWLDSPQSLQALLVRYEGPSLPDSFAAIEALSHHFPLDMKAYPTINSAGDAWEMSFFTEGACSFNAFPEIDSNNVWFGLALRCRSAPGSMEVMPQLNMALEERIPYQQLKG